MKYFLSLLCLAFAALALPPWAADVVSGSALETALFGSMQLPGGAIVYLRPPAEARANLSRLIDANSTPELHASRAQEAERAGDYTAAEADWKQADAEDLAAFYERRNQPAKEVAILNQIATVASFQRAIQVSSDALLSPVAVYEAWVAKFPQSLEPYRAYLHWTVQAHNQEAASNIAKRLKAAFPQDTELAVTTDAELAGGAAALAIYSQSFSPLWSETLRTRYFEELTKAHQLRAFLGDAQTAAAAHPDDLDPVGCIVFYQEQQKRVPAADAELLRFVAHREVGRTAWTPDELKTIAALFLRLHDYDESARFSWARDRESALTSVISLLLAVPEQPLNFANRDLSLFKDIARMDRHPGFLNGILTVALNTTDPESQYATASQTANSYFHRAAASRLLDQLKTEFPNSLETAALEAELFNAYALYQQDSALLRDVPAWMQRNTTAPAYLSTALLLADAYARAGKTSDETALYDTLLRTTKDADYNRVLDRYVSRLVTLQRLPDALTLLRHEIDRQPNEAALYERLALFVEQNHLDNDLEQTYRAALAHFKDVSWASKLARVYVRRKKTAAYEALSRQIADTFKGTQLAAFLTEVPPTSPALYRQINLYAHRRFPHNMRFVTNLLSAYNNKETLNTAAYEQLLRENWANDAGLRTLYLERLSRDGKLKTQLAALPAQDRNAAAAEFRAEANSWLTHFEEAAPEFVRLASQSPGDRSANDRAITAERSLGALPLAVHLAQQDVTAAPADRAALVRVGEIFADRDEYSQAKPAWMRAAAVHPGSADGYLDAATVFWDYLQYDDALKTIADARSKLKKPALFAYEAGAIDENKGAYAQAIGEYAQAVLRDSSEIAQQRLLTLARRPATRDLVETQTANLGPDGFALRLAILENQDRRPELQQLLVSRAQKADTTEDLEAVRAVAVRLGFDDIASQALVRTVAVTRDPIEKMAARLQLARFYEDHGNAAAAQQEYTSLAAAEPNRLGVVRAQVDYQWRAKQQKQAVATLEAAANRAQLPYQSELRREAAGKAADAGDFAEARRLLDQLLQDDRFNGDLLAQKAASYAREGDTAALNQFYSQTLKEMTAAPLGADDKKARVSVLRRGYILALNTASRFPEALEQYQQVLNAYPEDAALANEASRFAESHQLSQRLVEYYAKATQDAPRDYRWPLILARVETPLGHFAEAIAAYEKAGYVRPDRSDIPLAKADLQMRLLRFADVIKTYEKLYDLSYHDRQYLASQAGAYARMGNAGEAVRMLRAAYIELHPRDPEGFVTAMQKTNQWHLFDATQTLFAEVKPLLAAKPSWTKPTVELASQALVARHRVAEALALIAANVRKADEVAALLKSTGTAAGQYLTTLEKSALAQQMAKPGTWIAAQGAAPEFAEAAGLSGEQARLLLARARRSGTANPWQAVNTLQTRRLQFEELGHALESLAVLQRRQPATYRQIEHEAFQAYRDAGDLAGQRRLMSYSDDVFVRLFVDAGGDLNSRLVTLARQNKKLADQVVEYLVTTGPEGTAQSAIAARGSLLSPQWTNGYTALSGLYLASAKPSVNAAFSSILGPRTVADQLAKRDANVLPAPLWFYYASRFSDYLQEAKDEAGADDYRVAGLEAAPEDPNSYVALGDELVDRKQWTQAGVEYQQALELNPYAADVYDRLAILAMRKKDRTAAVNSWRKGLQLLTDRVEQGPLPQEYWTSAQTLLTHLNQANAATDLQGDVDALLRAYIKRNGIYQIGQLLEGVLGAAKDRAGTVRRMVQLAELPNANGLLGQLLEPDFLKAGEKDAVYRAQLAVKEKAIQQAAGELAIQAQTEFRQVQLDYARYLEEQRKWADAWVRLQQVQPAVERPADLLLTAAALTGYLRDLFKTYAVQPETAPTGEQLLSVAAALQSMGRQDLALELEEFAYGSQLQEPSAPATAYFGLARVRFAQKRNEEGLALVRSATLMVGEPFENLPAAVAELEAAGLKTDAQRYATEWSRAEPWNAQARLTAARLAGDAKSVEAVRVSADAGYDVRVQAARTLRALANPVNGSDELALLTHKAITAAEAQLPFAVDARLDAGRAATSSRDKVKLYREAIALDPMQTIARCELVPAAFDEKQESLGLAVFRSCALDPKGDTYRTAAGRAAKVRGQRAEYAQALQIYGQLLADESEGARKAEWAKARDGLLAMEQLQALNRARQPVVSEQLTQPQIVRPRLASLPNEEVLFK